MSPEEDQTRDAVDNEPKHYHFAIILLLSFIMHLGATKMESTLGLGSMGLFQSKETEIEMTDDRSIDKRAALR